MFAFRYDAMPKLTPPEDKSITTLYIGNVGEDFMDDDLRLFAETFQSK